MSYSTIAELRAFGVTTQDATDAEITAALATADIRINSYCGRTFGTPAVATITLDEVSGPRVPLPAFTAITEVLVAGVEVSEESYEVRPYGLLLDRSGVFDADGFLSPRGGGLRPNTPVTVKVTATFGQPVDAVIALAAKILTAGFVLLDKDDNLPPAQISETDNGDVTIKQGRVAGYTTGNLEVDGMLDDYLNGHAMVD